MIDFSPIQSIKMMRDVVYVMHDTSLKIYQSKKQALLEGNQAVAEQVGKGKDILSILSKWVTIDGTPTLQSLIIHLRGQ